MIPLSERSLSELKGSLSYQEARVDGTTWGVGICGHHARGSGWCAECLRSEIQRRQK